MTRIGTDPLRYKVDIYLPQQRSLQTELSWSDEGRACLQPELSDAWAREETIKLARVLKRTPKATLSRWRG